MPIDELDTTKNITQDDIPTMPKIDMPPPDLSEEPTEESKLIAIKNGIKRAATTTRDIVKNNLGKTSVGVLIVGTAIAYGLSGGEKPIKQHVQVAISEHFKNPVRFVGGPLKADSEKITTVFGESVIYESIPQEAACSVVFEAKQSKVGFTANPVLTFPVWWMTPGSTPLLIQESSADGYALWWATFQGNGCLAIADRSEYVGSDIHQLILHPRGRQLLAKGAKDETWFPYALAGRDDLNYVKADGVHPRKRKEQE